LLVVEEVEGRFVERGFLRGCVLGVNYLFSCWKFAVGVVIHLVSELIGDDYRWKAVVGVVTTGKIVNYLGIPNCLYLQLIHLQHGILTYLALKL
jgi:hypothetical protein